MSEQDQDQGVPDEEIFKDVLETIAPFIEQFSREGAHWAFAAALHSLVVRQGGAVLAEGVPDGYIDEVSLLAFMQVSQEALNRLRLMQDIIEGRVRIYYVSGQLIFSTKEIASSSISLKDVGEKGDRK